MKFQSTQVTISTALFVATALSWPQAAHADAVVDWNAIAASTIAAAPSRSGVGSPVLFIDMAIVQVAVYDAVQAFNGKYKPYHAQITGASGSPEAATAKAAHDVLVNIFPAQTATLDTTYRDYLTKKGISESDPGVKVGQAAAADILALRAKDGRVPDALPPPFNGETAAGVWRPTQSLQSGPPPSGSAMGGSWLGTAISFSLERGDQFRAKPPPTVTSDRYTKDYNEVKSLGGLNNSARTPEQTELAYFYAGNFFVLWHRALREIADQSTNGIVESARLLALANMAMSDTIITVWDSKRHFGYWRPITAIQEGDNDGNPATVGDPSWQPLLNTPNYPEYSSGANGVTAAMTGILALYFGKDEMTFTVTSEHPKVAQKTRTYDRFSDMANDMVNVRIYHGVHFRTADEEAREQGGNVAKWVYGHAAIAR
jgi:hypothetical protein